MRARLVAPVVSFEFSHVHVPLPSCLAKLLHATDFRKRAPAFALFRKTGHPRLALGYHGQTEHRYLCGRLGKEQEGECEAVGACTSMYGTLNLRSSFLLPRSVPLRGIMALLRALHPWLTRIFDPMPSTRSAFLSLPLPSLKGMSGRTLRRLPVLAHARYIGLSSGGSRGGGTDPEVWLEAMAKALTDTQGEQAKVLQGSGV